jgi:hypothetical protein
MGRKGLTVLIMRDELAYLGRVNVYSKKGYLTKQLTDAQGTTGIPVSVRLQENNLITEAATIHNIEVVTRGAQAASTLSSGMGLFNCLSEASCLRRQPS